MLYKQFAFNPLKSLKCVLCFFKFFFRVMEKDPFHANCLPVHIGTLVELNKANGKEHSI